MPHTQIDHLDEISYYRHSVEITKPFGTIDSILTWTKSELAGEWRWQLVQVSSTAQPGRYIFYFDSEADYLAFVLKFS
jgi:hypothetical protein